MVYIMYRFLANTKELLDVQLQTSIQLLDNRDLPPIIDRLEWSDKEYLRNVFINSDWNAGSRNVLVLLQNARILSISDYVYHKCTALQHQNPQIDETINTMHCDDAAAAVNDRVVAAAEHIFNDLLDGNFELLADIVWHLNGTHAKSLMLSELLESGVRRLIVDLCAHPELKHRCYFRKLQSINTLPAHKLNAFRSLHIRHLLALEEHSVYETIGLLAEWRKDEATDGRMSASLLALMRSSIEPATTSTVPAKCAELLAMVQTIGFTGWRWWLQLWRLSIAEASSECFVTIRQLLKELFRRFLSNRNDSCLGVMLICARWTAWLRGDKCDFGTYADWFRWTFGEMSTVVQVDEFRRTIESLAKLVPYERDVEALKVVAETRFATPPHCFETVRGLKGIAKICMADLQRQENRVVIGADAEKDGLVGSDDDDDVIMLS